MGLDILFPILPNVTTDQTSPQSKWLTDAVNNALKQYETRATFKLKSMTREFSTVYEVQVTDLKIPTGYDLEAE